MRHLFLFIILVTTLVAGSARAFDVPAPAACDPTPSGMACVPAGLFIRGSDDGPKDARPAQSIWLQTFYMDIDEVTVKDFTDCIKSKKCPQAAPKYVGFMEPQMPMNGVSWFDAANYCAVHGKRLPTEAEWEKAARGTDGKMFPWGNDPATCQRAIIMDKSGRGCGRLKPGSQAEKGRPWAVGSRPAGIYGIRDMAGNAYEWVADWHSKSYEDCGVACAGVNPLGPCEGKAVCPGHHERVVRGGSWYWPGENARGFHRRAHVPGNNPFHHFGFRCAASEDATVAR